MWKEQIFNLASSSSIAQTNGITGGCDTFFKVRLNVNTFKMPIVLLQRLVKIACLTAGLAKVDVIY